MLADVAVKREAIQAKAEAMGEEGGSGIPNRVEMGGETG